MNILKSLAIGLSLTLVSVSVAQNVPDILGVINNESGGLIVFTTKKAQECKPEEYFVYAKEKNGRVGIAGCYNFLGDKEIVVRYFDGSVYSYDSKLLEITEEFLEFMKQREQKQGSNT